MKWSDQKIIFYQFMVVKKGRIENQFSSKMKNKKMALKSDFASF